MNDMKIAMEKVIRVPLIKRCWLMLKDKPGRTANELASVLKNTPKAISSALSTLQMRGMVDRTLKLRHDNKREFSYSIPFNHREYELLPMKAVKPAKVLDMAPSEALEPANATLATTEPPVSHSIDIDQLTVAEARSLYLQLHKMFGNK